MDPIYFTVSFIVISSSFSLCNAQMMEQVEHILILKNIFDQNQKLLGYFEGQQEKMASLEIKMETLDSKFDLLEEVQLEKMASLESKLDVLQEHSAENQLCSKQDQLEDFKNIYESGKQDIVTSLEQSSCREHILDLQDYLATDECEVLTHNCSDAAICTDQQILYRCVCLPGYSGDGFTCTDVDECSKSDVRCGTNEICTNFPGTYECQCLKGYERGDGHCQDVDECTRSDVWCGANEICMNSAGTYECQCLKGYERDDGHCQDVDECTRSDVRCGANEVCTNSPGTYECQCLPGYERNDGHCQEYGQGFSDDYYDYDYDY